MKKALLAIAMLFALSMTANAQNAIGVRLGAGAGTDAEVSYQMGMGSNQIEFDLGLMINKNRTNFHLAGIYQWKGNIAGPVNWYAGVGANLAYNSWKAEHADGHSALGLAVGGQAGLEFDFGIPFLFTLDVRPMWDVLNFDAGDWGGVAFGIRYKL